MEVEKGIAVIMRMLQQPNTPTANGDEGKPRTPTMRPKTTMTKASQDAEVEEATGSSRSQTRIKLGDPQRNSCACITSTTQ